MRPIAKSGKFLEIKECQFLSFKRLQGLAVPLTIDIKEFSRTFSKASFLPPRGPRLVVSPVGEKQRYSSFYEYVVRTLRMEKPR
tara:strand:- start:17 stop:268 length:252 start_codon:yes stop_codon:yes gene_type:complete